MLISCISCVILKLHESRREGRKALPKVKEKALKELQADATLVSLAKKWGIDRSTLWRIRHGGEVGHTTIEAFKKAYPDKSIEYYFDFGV